MKKLIFAFGFTALIILITSCSHNKIFQCGENVVYHHDRYRIVISKCGEPDHSVSYKNDYGINLGRRLTYGSQYCYFDRWERLYKVEPIPTPSAFDALPYRFGGLQSGFCRPGVIISLGNRLEDVLSRCGDPADYADFMDAFGDKKNIELRYDQNEERPIYFYFDRPGICTRIRTGSARR